MRSKHGMIICDYCKTEAPDRVSAHQMSWDWFTGYNETTFHSCYLCKQENIGDFKERLMFSRINKETPTENPQ